MPRGYHFPFEAIIFSSRRLSSKSRTVAYILIASLFLTGNHQFLFVYLSACLLAPASTRPPSAGSKSRPGSSSPTPGSRPAGSTSPERRPPSFHATAAAVHTTSALQQSRKSPVQRGNLGSTGYVEISVYFTFCNLFFFFCT